MTRFWYCRGVGAVVVALGLLATALAAPPQQVVEQKAESEVAAALAGADQQARINNRAKAVAILKEAKQNLQFAAIGESTLKRLSDAIDAKIALYEGKAIGAPAPGAGAKLDPKGAEVTAAQKAAAEKAAAEYKDVIAGLKAVQKAEDAGRTAEANAEIARLTKLYPTNPAVQALGNTGTIKTRLDDAIAFQAQMNDRWVKNQQNIMKSSLPAIMDVEFPADWKEKSKRRLQTVEMSAKEKKIIEALDKPVSVNFRERPFEEALQDLSNKLDQPLLLDKASVKDLELDLKRGASLEANGLSGRTVLRSILATQGLTFVVKDETIQIVTVERARSLLTTRVYYLGDLIKGTGVFGGPEWGPFLNAEQTAENAKQITAMITKSIDPLSWRENGGPGSVTFHAPSMSIIVRSSAEVHFTLGRSFGGGK